MLARAKALDSRCAFIDGGTFHATATKIINQNIHVFGMDRPFTILDPEDATQIVKKVMEPIKADDNRNWPRASTVDRTSGVSGKSVSVRVDLGGRRIIKK